LKHVNNVIWESLSKARHVDEKWAWEGKVGSEDKVFFTPQKNLRREETSGSVGFNGQTHLEVNGVVHAYIAKQLTDLNIIHSLGSTTPNRSKSESSLKCAKGIKIGDKKSSPIPPTAGGCQGKT
jgi:hypothetical protein